MIFEEVKVGQTFFDPDGNEFVKLTESTAESILGEVEAFFGDEPVRVLLNESN